MRESTDLANLQLYLLELAVPLVPPVLYSEVKAVYPSVGAESVDQEARNASILAVLARVPKIHLIVLDELLKHLKALISSTKTEETDGDYITKLGHILGPCILRPPVESSKTFNDRFPALFFSDLVKSYDDILPRTMEAKDKVEEERYAPKRQRTKMVDQRMTRSSGLEPLPGTGQRLSTERSKDWLKQELEKRNGSKVTDEPESLDVPAPAPKEDKGTLPQIPQPELDASSAAHEQDTQSKEPPADSDAPEAPGPQAEELEIPVPASEAGSVSPGFVTPAEISLESTGMTAGQSASSMGSAEPIAPVLETEEEEDLDKPLSSTVALSRSTDGSLPRRSNALSSSTKTRGPRPMSMQGPPSASSSPASNAGGGGASGVRARAAMFEQRGGDGQPSSRGENTNLLYNQDQADSACRSSHHCFGRQCGTWQVVRKHRVRPQLHRVVLVTDRRAS